MLEDLKGLSIPDRESKILDIIEYQPQRVYYYWKSLTHVEGSNYIKIFVMGDALKIDNIRINVSARCMQMIADKLNCVLPTAKICDLIWHYSDQQINPFTRSITSSLEAMIEHSEKIEKLAVNQNLIGNAGKNWILINELTKGRIPNQACNYGWHFTGNSHQGITGNICASLLKNPKTGMYWKLIQPASYHHDFCHSDYSQTCRLVYRECFVNDVKEDITNVLSNPSLAKLLSHEGVLKINRHPGIPKIDLNKTYIKPEEFIEVEMPTIDNIEIPTLTNNLPLENVEEVPVEVNDTLSIKPIILPAKAVRPNIFTFIFSILKLIIKLFGRNK